MERILIVRLEPIKDKYCTMTTEAVYNYLKKQNRPYSAIDLASTLDKEKHGKSAIQKSLDKLVDSGKIFVKVNAKQKVYCVKQASNQNLEELKRIERELQTHSNEQIKKLQELENEVRSHEVTLNSLKCGMSLEEAQKQQKRLEEVTGKLSTMLDELMESSGTEDLSEVKKKAESSLSLYNREYTKRKRMCNDVLDCILESYPGTKKQLFSEIGINVV
ncbi:homologous-pairing protein 2 homolog [Nasonia vitripennis]|uniref:Homologous-pairing protein 2 homolog n=2 Tax=Nasonia vitripennis TaxID=7425 RepID=A0A7M6UCV5_NASVI|nr:homologous-pairing protein 2 homolog [Nasonia vitripennis]